MLSMKTIENKLGSFELHETLVIARFAEGIDLGFENVPEITEMLSDHFDRPFGWIADRVNRYSVDPYIVRMILDETPKLSSWCNVVHKETLIDHLPFVKQVAPKDFPKASFKRLQEAIDWTEKQVARIS